MSRDILAQLSIAYHIYPVTLRLRNAPTLYGPVYAERRAYYGVEVGIFTERLYQRSVARKHRGPSWQFLGWIEHGGRSGFAHVHGIYAVPKTLMHKPLNDVPGTEALYGDSAVVNHHSPGTIGPEAHHGWLSYIDHSGEPLWYRTRTATP